MKQVTILPAPPNLYGRFEHSPDKVIYLSVYYFVFFPDMRYEDIIKSMPIFLDDFNTDIIPDQYGEWKEIEQADGLGYEFKRFQEGLPND